MTRADAIVFAGMLLAVALAGCTDDPFCLYCPEPPLPDGAPEAGLDGGADGAADGGAEDASIDAPVVDDVAADGCGVAELCNERDDDCDGVVDEGIDTSSSIEHCGGCGRFCAPAHAFGRCEGGTCLVDECSFGFVDSNGDPADGCEYRCTPSAADDAICDFRDDDCDGAVDEDVALMTDPTNCGRCGRFCRSPHAAASCVAGECALGACEDGFYDVDGVLANGCEYACTRADPPMESCNLRDDDCDGRTDEGDPGGGAPCGTDEGECRAGTTRCMAGALVCEGAVGPVAELCNGLDDDCDTRIDEGNPDGGRVCGTSLGACEVGRQECVAGEIVCIGAVGPSSERCNGIDDDCDGAVDEGNPEGGAACGETTGACEPGTLTCTGGGLACVGGVGPIPELCNGVDDDCDGTADDGNPEAGALCGTDLGRCSPGVQDCVGGAIVCVGATGPVPESCDGTDEDCDGAIDEGNPGGGAPCGESTGACEPGAIACAGGTLVCVGGVGPSVEVCNTVDDDCDGRTDEGFSLASDVRNCGACGRVCTVANGTPRCTAGGCGIASCNPGFVDLDGSPANGCEYACSFSGGEACNGRDDDCDGRTDEGLTPPPGFCNPQGVCAGTTATCGGATGWVCNYPAATYQTSESRCDGLDNDCDGAVDEPFPLLGTTCANGVGLCRRTGVYVCTADGTGTVCNAPPAGTPGVEACNGLDDDCNGAVDDAIPLAQIPHVTFTSGGRTVRMMQYEASRPDATSTSAGTVSTVACSRPNVLPWTSVTQAQAQAACCALNPGGTCSGTSGWRLCAAEDWETGCRGPSGTCRWSYQSMCTSSQRTTCNGMEYDSDPALPGDQDAVYPTGSATFPMCNTDWGAAGRIFDLSGNVKEWTSTQVSPGVYEVRGGSYQSVEAGRACDFDFTVAEATFSAPTTGFRCCMY